MDNGVRRSPMPFAAGFNGGGGGGGREELWSEAETAALVDAWGERYIRLNRGSLRQGDWREVAVAVNAARAAAGRPPKSDVQCKNRVDTLKKKYKIEKSKLGRSLWPFFSDLDFLIGGGAAVAESGKPTSLTASPVPFDYPQSRPRQLPRPTFAVKRRSPIAGAAVHAGSWLRPPVNSSGSSESSRGDFDDGSEDHDDGEDEDDACVGRDQGLKRNAFFNGGVAGVKRPRSWDDFGGGASVGGGSGGGKDRALAVVAGSNGARKDGAFSELAGAIMKLADIYEKVESSKQQQMIQMERQRMEFTKDLEFQRMKMFMDAQLEVEKMKRPKNHPGIGQLLATYICIEPFDSY